MPRAATGQVLERVRAKGIVYGLRFVANGRREYVTLGSREDGWNRERAEVELANVLADVRRGIWRRPEPEPTPVVAQDPTFHAFASGWFEAHRGEWREKTRLDYEWQLSHHLLPFFKHHRLSQITIAEVDRYKAAKVAEARSVEDAARRGKPIMFEYVDARGRTHLRRRRPLSATSINKTITRLAQILEVAVEYGLTTANPAKGRRRRLRTVRAVPVWLDRAEHIEALLDAAGQLDRHAGTRGGHDQKGGLVYRRALLATLVFAGLRMGELTALRWRDLDLAANRLIVHTSKTDAGVRQIDLLPVLRDELAAYKARAPSTEPDGYVFATAAGTQPKQANIRRRVFDQALELANEKVVEAGDVPLPERLTPHKLRHTFASILVASGVDPGVVMDQLGHADPGFTLRVYRHGMRRDPTARERLRALVGAVEWAPTGTNGSNGALADLIGAGLATPNTAPRQ
jgi:integrase